MTDNEAAQAVSSALRLIKEALFALGAEGDECIQKLVAVEVTLAGMEPNSAQKIVFEAFHAGFSAPDGHWAGDTRLRKAHETGAAAALLNARARENGRMNNGPFDAPRTRWAIDEASRLTTS